MIYKDQVLNLNHKYRHWSEKNSRVKACKQLGIVKSRTLGRFNKVRMDVYVSYPKAFDADVNNYTPTMKAYLDGLINIAPVPKGGKKQPGRGILPDDSDEYFRGPYLHPSGQKSGLAGWFKFHVILTVQ